jgi:hypothetical protein
MTLSIFKNKSWLPCNSDKVCVDAITKQPINHLDASLHMTYDDAKRVGLGTSWVVEPGYFVIDIDSDCEKDLAVTILKKFDGAYMEVSNSGKGYHIIARYSGQRPDHKSKNTKLDIELYTGGRHILITGKCKPGGDSERDFTQELMWIIGEYFAPREIIEAPAVTPSQALSDEELLKKAFKNKNPFSDASIFKSYFDADAEVLGVRHPHDTNPFDYSSADMSFCNQLAFWSGGNAEQIDRIYRQSKLMRDKWERDDYRNWTISRAIKDCQKFYAAMPEAVEGEEYNLSLPILTISEQRKLFDGFVYVLEENAIRITNGMLLGHDQFKNNFGGSLFTMDAFGQKTTRDAWEAFMLSQVFKFPRCDKTIFNPFKQPGEIMKKDGLTHVNIYMPCDIESTPGDCTLFFNHLKNLLPDRKDRAILISWMAAVVQNPWRKIMWAPVIQGVEGSGKSLVTNVMLNAIGEAHTHVVNSKDLDNKFNAWLRNKRLIIVPEINTRSRRETIEDLKPMIGDETIQIQGKGADQSSEINYANFIMTTNFKDALSVDDNTRRYAIFLTHPQSRSDILNAGMDGVYFKNLFSWMQNGGYSHCTNFLQSFKIPDDLNPFLGLQRAPQTSTSAQAILESEHPLTFEIKEMLEEEPVGMRGGWVSTIALGDNLNRGIDIKYAIKQLTDIFGYVKHPLLRDGRAGRVSVLDGGKKPRLYVKKDHYTLQKDFKGDIIDAYIEDQSK